MVKKLTPYIGKSIIRTGPNKVTGDRSFLDQPITLIGFTLKGNIIYKFSPGHSVFDTSKTYTLDSSFVDDQWIELQDLYTPKDNDLIRYLGKKIHRVRPAIYSHGVKDNSYIEEPLVLVSATRYHLVVKHTDVILRGKETILPFEFSKPEEWVSA